jgi:ABC-type antimicrobial peptide transport system permease subunit
LPPIDEIEAGRDYFRTIGARLVAGRTFTSADDPHSPPVVVVNEALAQRLYRAGNALGRSMAGPNGTATIIGIVANVRPQLEAQASGVVYPSAEQAGLGSYEELLVRTSGAPDVTENAIKGIMHTTDPLLPPPRMHRMDDVVAQAVAPRKFVFVLLTMFSGVAALLAVIGLYGVLSRVVLERTREIGIRMALGADARGVIASVLGQALGLVAIGVGLGLVGAVDGARVMQSLVYDTSVHDPVVFAGATALLVAVSLLAAYLPARRATGIDPVTALRAE